MNESVVAYLELAAAKAKQLALDYKNGRLWEGDVQRGIGEITTHLRNALSMSGEAR